MKIVHYVINLIHKLFGKNDSQDKEKGAITVAETLIALGVGATVLSAVFAGIPALMDARNASAGMNGLTQIVSSVRMTFGVRNSFSGLNTNLAKSLAGFPKQFLIEGEDEPRLPWNGDVEINGTGQTFTVKFSAMPDAACSSLIASTANMAQSVNIGGTELDLQATDDASTIGTDESEAADIARLCANTPPNDLVWKFRG